jgi:hypothetical protein
MVQFLPFSRGRFVLLDHAPVILAANKNGETCSVGVSAAKRCWAVIVIVCHGSVSVAEQH